jgi:hypothetical protein
MKSESPAAHWSPDAIGNFGCGGPGSALRSGGEAKTIRNSAGFSSAQARNAVDAATIWAAGSSAGWASRAAVIEATTSTKMCRVTRSSRAAALST